jgi:hypothetical protein
MTRPVAVSDLGDDLAALLDGFEDGAHVELEAKGGLDTDLDVVEIDEYGNFQSLIGHRWRCGPDPVRTVGQVLRPA